MFLMVLLQFVFWVLLVLLAVTQVIMPLVQKRALFPLFRARRSTLEGEIVELNEQIREENLADEAEMLRKRLEEMRKADATTPQEKQ